MLIGRIIGAHGTGGVCKIVSYADSLDVFAPGNPLFVEAEDADWQSFDVLWVKPHAKGARMALSGVSDREAAEKLRGAALYVDKRRLPALDTESYYWFELIGMEVFTQDGVLLGRLDSILPTGSNDVYVVRRADRETLVPALASVVRRVDTERRRMEVVLPEGL